MTYKDITLHLTIQVRYTNPFAPLTMRLITNKQQPPNNKYISDVPDIVCQEYAIPHMQDLIPKIPGTGYTLGARATAPPPLNNFFPKPPPVPPPPEKYYAATPITKSSTPTSPSTQLNIYSDGDLINSSNSDDLQNMQDFPRHSLVIVEKLGSGSFGELHLCETKGLR